MKFDLKMVLDRPGEVDVVTTDVDLTGTRFHGQRPFKAPVTLEAKASNRAGVVSLDCTYRYSLQLLCDRCAAPTTKDVTLKCSHTVVRELNGEDDEEFLVLPEGVVELDELAANDILPELPAKFLCREDCLGLCPICGRDLNAGECGCDRRVSDPRWDALNKM